MVATKCRPHAIRRASSTQASSTITITGAGDHDQPDWLITMTGSRRLCRWARRTYMCGVAGIGRLEHHANELLAYLERNQGALVHHAARRWRGEAISTAFV